MRLKRIAVIIGHGIRYLVTPHKPQACSYRRQSPPNTVPAWLRLKACSVPLISVPSWRLLAGIAAIDDRADALLNASAACVTIISLCTGLRQFIAMLLAENILGELHHAYRRAA